MSSLILVAILCSRRYGFTRPCRRRRRLVDPQPERQRLSPELWCCMTTLNTSLVRQEV
jgi:hypothetical protein